MLHRDITINGRKDLRLILLVGYGQLWLLSNQIAGFFDRQYLRKISINALDFFHGEKHQQKKGSEVTTFSVIVSCASPNQVAGFFDHQYLWKESIEILEFLHGDNCQQNEGSETTTSDWVWSVWSRPIRL